MNDAPIDAPEAIEAPVAQAEITRPADVPDKFWDDDAGSRAHRCAREVLPRARAQARIRSARAGAGAGSHPDGRSRDHRAEPAPLAEPEAWAIASPHPLIEPDGELNDLLRSAGFDQTQAQLVYDLAAQRLLPVIQDALGEIEAQQQLERLQRHFGGADTWGHTARQLKSWAASHLDPSIHETLASSYEGVLALHQMMRASEPELLAGAAEPASELSEAALVELMRDPRYWRQRDPEFIARVTAGFKRLYAD